MLSTTLDTEQLASRLKELGKQAGLDRVGITTTDPFPTVQASLQARRQRGYSARMGFTFSNPERSADPGHSFGWANRLVVAGRSYLPEAGNPGPSAAGTGRIARFSTQDWYQPLRQGLEKMANQLASWGFRAEVVHDDSRLVDRAAAVRAGIGWWGKNTMVLSPGLGPWMLLGSVVTDAVLPVDQPMRRTCGTCIACLPACPTDALIAPGVLDAGRCLSYLLQAPGDIPREFRPLVEDRVYGCDDCLEACPPGKSLMQSSSKRAGRVELEEMLRSDDRSLLDEFARFYIPRRDPDYLRRNALVALGNGRLGSSLPVLREYSQHSRAMLRRHAVWGVGRVGGPEALSWLQQLPQDPDLGDELSFALALAQTVQRNPAMHWPAFTQPMSCDPSPTPTDRGTMMPSYRNRE